MIDMKNHNERKNACNRMRRDQLSTSLPPSKSCPTLFILTQIHIILPPLPQVELKSSPPKTCGSHRRPTQARWTSKVGCPNKRTLFRRVVLGVAAVDAVEAELSTAGWP